MTTGLPGLTAALADRYRIERELGAGGMATVYLARDIRHDRDVALKVLRPELSAVLGGERFLQEIRITARLDHPHILTLIDSGESDSHLWYVLPYVRGESLRQKLVREKQLAVEEAIRIAKQVAGAMDYAHREGVIHRDIKPENILLHEGEAVVADFGIALAVREAGGERLTQTGLSLGTPHYMSPEQATGDGELGPRTDVYSLGAVVYEMLAGEPPISGATAHAVIAKLLTERPTRLRTVRDTIPEALDNAVARALAKVPADRFATAGDFANALERQDALPATARDRHRALIAGLLAVLALLSLIVLLRIRLAGTGDSAAPATDAASVAVMPFDNLSGDPADQYLSHGMTEEVIGQLAKVGSLKVISRTSTEALKGTQLTLRQIAETLGVRHILEGSVRRAGNRIRVAVNLIEATTDANTWSSTYDRDLADVFAVQEEIARQVVDSLVRTVGMRPSLSQVARTEHPRAYEAYQVGRYLMQRRTGPGLRGAMEKFEEAIGHDSAYAPPRAGLAAVFALMAFYGYPGIDFYGTYGRAWALADRAVALNPALAEGYAVRGLIGTFAWGSAEEIAADFMRALELRPNSPDVHLWNSPFRSRQGLQEEAVAEARRASELDPLAPGPLIAMSYSALAARRPDVTIREASRAIGLEPGLMRPRAFRAMGELISGNAERCAAEELGPNVVVRTLCLHTLGRVADATRLADSLASVFTTRTGQDSTFSPVLVARGLAQYHAWIGDVEGSLTWLDRAYALSPVGEDYTVIASPIYDKVRDDPRFQAGLERLHEQIHARVLRAKRES